MHSDPASLCALVVSSWCQFPIVDADCWTLGLLVGLLIGLTLGLLVGLVVGSIWTCRVRW